VPGLPPLRAGVVGVGHLGQHHARIYATLEGVTLVGVADTRRARAEEIAARSGCRVFEAGEDLLAAGVDLVSIATPTESHVEAARPFIEAGKPVLVEKPLARTVAEARTLVDLARARGAAVQVGHVERFNPAVLAVRPVVREPRFISCDRVSPFRFRSTDVGVVLDVMIHDLDVALHLMKRPVVDVEAFGVPVLSRTEDLAHARLRFEGGGIAVLTASRVSVKTERKIRIFQPDAYLSLDYGAKKGRIFRKRPGFETLSAEDLAGIDPQTPPEWLEALVFSKYLEMEEVSMEGEEPLKAELRSFVDAVRRGSGPEVTAEDGLRAIEVADRIVRDLETRLDVERSPRSP